MTLLFPLGSSKKEIQERNTAIFYDIENLIGGYGKTDIAGLSLKDIHEKILQKEIGQVAIQRAYANWSDPRLNILRGDIVELGIDPIQMFGFGKGPQKNASDIQLAIDAVEIALHKDSIKIFVIVSGDGGFSVLAKKLHEYGKTVIGCAFARTINKIFKSVCDDFIWIEDPKEEYSQNKESVPEITDPILIDYCKKYSPIQAKGEEVINEAKKILEFFATHNEANYLLKNVGMNISIFSQAINYRINQFNYAHLGFTKFVDFIRYVVKEGKIKLIHNPPSEYRLLFKECSIKNFIDIEPIHEIQNIHMLESYKIILGKGAPVFKLPSKDVIFTISRYLAEHRSHYQDMLLADMVDDISQKIDYTQEDIKSILISLISAKCFTKTPEDAKFSESRFSFLYDSTEETIQSLKQAVHKKLFDMLGRVDENILSEIIS